jgi:hypothetical protein
VWDRARDRARLGYVGTDQKNRASIRSDEVKTNRQKEEEMFRGQCSWALLFVEAAQLLVGFLVLELAFAELLL